jgi:membrane protein
MQRIKKYLLQTGPVQVFFNFTKRIILPGFEGLPLYDVGRFFFHGIRQGEINSRASSLSFKFFLAIFPGLLFLFTLIPYIPIENFQVQLLLLLKEILPKTAYDETKDTLADIVAHKHRGVLSFSFFFALYLLTDGVTGIIKAFNKSAHVIDNRGVWRIRLIAIILVFILTLILLTGISLIFFSSLGIKYLVKAHFIKKKSTIILLSILKWIIIFFLFFFMISFMYYLAPDKKLNWKFINAGGTFATVLSILLSLCFAYYVNNFGMYNKLYGSIGTLIVFMLWIFFNSNIILLGFELNASIYYGKKLYEDTEELY